MDFDAVADELYTLAPEEFTAARNAGVKQARAEGDRQLASRIQALRKPTVAAWLTNQLVRAHGPEVDVLLDLGRELREVLADVKGDELRELTRQRYQLVSALVRQARSLAQTQGRRISDEVAQAVRTTLEATLSDDASANLVAAGRLSDGLDVSGFSVGWTGDVSPVRSATRASSGSGTVTDLDAERQRRARKQAERDVGLAEKAVERADAAHTRAQERVTSAAREREDSAATVDRLRQELQRAIAEVERREQHEEAARHDVGESQRGIREAEAELASARSRLEQVTTPDTLGEQ